MALQLGLGHFWRGVTVLFSRGDDGVLHRMIVYPEGENVHDLIGTSPDRFMILNDTFVADTYATAFEMWDFRRSVFDQYLLPRGLMWGKLITSPSAAFFAVVGVKWGRASYLLIGELGQPATLIKFPWPKSFEMNVHISVTDIADDGGVFVFQRGGAGGPDALYRFQNRVPVGQFVKIMSPDEFPFLAKPPYFTPSALSRRDAQLSGLLPDGAIPSSADASQMEHSLPMPMNRVRHPVHLIDGGFGSRG